MPRYVTLSSLPAGSSVTSGVGFPAVLESVRCFRAGKSAEPGGTGHHPRTTGRLIGLDGGRPGTPERDRLADRGRSDHRPVAGGKDDAPGRSDASQNILCRRPGYHLVRPDDHIAAHGHECDLHRLATELSIVLHSSPMSTKVT